MNIEAKTLSHGGDGGQERVFELQSGEYIISAEGSFGQFYGNDILKNIGFKILLSDKLNSKGAAKYNWQHLFYGINLQYFYFAKKGYL